MCKVTISNLCVSFVILNNPVSDGNVNYFNDSLVEMEISQNDLGHSLDELKEEISSLSANASCEEISKFNVIEDGYYMIRFQIWNFQWKHPFLKWQNREILKPKKDTAINGITIIQSSLQIQYNNQ